MYKLLITFMLLVGIKSNAQEFYVPETNLKKATAEWREFSNFLSKDIKIVSKYDTTVLFIGMEICTHDWATKDNFSGYNGMRYASCAVVHDTRGCPDTWDNYNSICAKCLRHINVKEHKIIQEVKIKYDEALERLNKLKKN